MTASQHLQSVINGHEKLDVSAVPLLWAALDDACADYEELAKAVPDEDFRAHMPDKRKPVLAAFLRVTDARAAPELLRMLRQGEQSHRIAAYNAFAAIGPDCFEVISAGLHAVPTKNRTELLEALLATGLPEAFDLVLETVGRSRTLHLLWLIHRQMQFKPEHPAKRFREMLDWSVAETIHGYGRRCCGQPHVPRDFAR